jgi:hypothetical protein
MKKRNFLPKKGNTKGLKKEVASSIASSLTCAYDLLSGLQPIFSGDPAILHTFARICRPV